MFTKIVAMKCATDGCEMKDKQTGARITICRTCNKPNQPVTVLNAPLVAALAMAVLCGLGGGLYAGPDKGWIPRLSTQPQPPPPGGAITPVNPPPAVPQPPAEPTEPASLAYVIQADAGGYRGVSADHVFQTGDRMRIVVKPSFAAYLYCFHEDAVTGDIDTIPAGGQPMEPNTETAIPPAKAIRMDAHPGPERFILIASARQLPELEFSPGARVTKAQFHSITERLLQSASTTEVRDGNWTKIEGPFVKGSQLLRASFTLKHE